MTDSGRLSDRVAVVTGAGRGIGRATALRLAAEGARVLVVDLDRSTAEQTVREIGDSAAPEVADLADRDARRRVVPAALERFGRVDILVNNAAYHGDRTSLFDVTAEDWDRVLATNLTAIFELSRDAARGMATRGRGAIVNLTSLHERLPILTYAAYGTSKGGLLALTHSLATELSPLGIRVNAIQPAVIATDGAVPPAGQPATLLGRSGTPDEIAAAVAFLVSDDASFVTGVELPVDGGRGISRRSDPIAAQHQSPGG